jgi:CRP-like cAMP-binding protein
VRQDELSANRQSRFDGGVLRSADASSGEGKKDGSISSYLRSATSYTARCRQIIHYQGRPTSAVYFVESGRIKCTSTASDGRELLLCEFGPGEFLGLVEAFNGAPALATAVATETSVLRSMRKESFRSLVGDDSDLALTLAQILAQGLKSAYERYTDLAYEPLERRVLRTLSKLACKCDGTIVVDRSLSVNELATMVAASRPRVSMAVQELIRRGRLSRIEGKFVLSESRSYPALPR